MSIILYNPVNSFIPRHSIQIEPLNLHTEGRKEIESSEKESGDRECFSTTQQAFGDPQLGISLKQEDAFKLGADVESSCLAGIVGLKQRLSIADRLARNQIDAMSQQENEQPKGYRDSPLILKPKGILKKQKYITIEGEIRRINLKLIGIGSSIGLRNVMEDHEIASEGMFSVQGKEYSFDLFGIFDGHGGANASFYVKMNIQQYLIEALEGENQQALTDEGIFLALKKCLTKLDEDYEGVDGTTATIALILEGKVWVANVGDSRIIFIDKEGNTIQATEDAKPNMPTYLKKIVKLEGEIELIRGCWRINGVLAVARAIGDKQIKGSTGLCCVSPSPKITSFPLADFDKGHLVLACDGLYDAASTNEIGAAVYSMVNRYSLEVICRKLVYCAIKNGSEDNVSVMIVKL
ncbi:MAG: PP2C family serine/threonine-protein phosphatase [Parachlamydiaceae bacterium]